jgi:hypothetical protein
MSTIQIVNLCLHSIIQDCFHYLFPLNFPIINQSFIQTRLKHHPLLNIAYPKYLLLSSKFDRDWYAFHKKIHSLIHLYHLTYPPYYKTNLVIPNHNYFPKVKLNQAMRNKSCSFRKNLLFHYHSHLTLQCFENYHVMYFIYSNHL